MAIKNQDHPFFRPLWRRIAIVVVTAVWCFVEWYHGQATWVFISGAICIYAIRTFLMTYPKTFPGDEPDRVEGDRT